MSKYLFLYREKAVDDRDCCAYIEAKNPRFECDHYFGGVGLHGACYCGHDFPDYKDIETIRKEQLTNFNIREGQPYSDRSLISNAPTDDTVFEASFYSAMRSNGIPNQEYIKLVNQINDILAPYYDTASRTLYTSEITEEDLQTLTELYDKIESINKTTNSTNGKAIRKYIKENVTKA